MNSEYEDCIMLAQYLDMRGIMFSHVPNSTYTSSWNQKRRNKALGVSPGVPDYLIILPDYTGILFIEMKKEKGGVVSDYQKKWISELNKCSNIQAMVCRGYEEAVAFVETFYPMKTNELKKLPWLN